MSGYSKPIGFLEKILAKGMAWGHRDFYINTAKKLDLENDDSYLEIGFGSGMFIKQYVKDVKRIAGIDYSIDMVRLAEAINEENVKNGKVEFKQADVSFIPYNDNEFSIAVAIESFYFWTDPEKALLEIYRVLKKDGRIIIEMAYNKDDGKDHEKDVRKMKLLIYSFEQMKKLLKETGFKDIEVSYYQGFKIPLKGYVVPKGMIIKAIK